MLETTQGEDRLLLEKVVRQFLEIALAIAVKTRSNNSSHLFHTPLDAMFAGRAWEGRSSAADHRFTDTTGPERYGSSWRVARHARRCVNPDARARWPDARRHANIRIRCDSKRSNDGIRDVTAIRLQGIRACVFDAYGTLFDVNSAARAARDALGSRWQPLADLWRTKQLQYTWLRGLGGHHADFWQVTSDALSFAMESLRIDDADLHRRLMSLYLSLDAFPDVKPALERLKEGGLRLAILSNGTPAMLASAVDRSGIGPLLDAVLSVEEVGVFKPHPSVYRLASDRLQLAPEAICFLSSNGWDAHAAKAFGFRVVWCNRFGQVPERIPATPDAQMATLSALPDAVLP